MSYTPAEKLLQVGRVVEITTRYQFATWKPDRVVVEINDDPFSSDSITLVVGSITIGSNMTVTISGYLYDVDRCDPDYKEWRQVRVSANAFRVVDV